MARIPATDYLANPDKYPPKPVCVAFGEEFFLRRQVLLGLRHSVLGDDEGDFSLTSFEGPTAEFRQVADELTTMAMFGSQRLVMVDEADEFVSRWREALEDYVARPSRSGILLLDVKSWPSNTRLYKAIDAHGLPIDCSALAANKLASWLGDWAKQMHKIQLPRNAADMLIEMVGSELGLLDQELAKLALMAGNDKKIMPEMIQKMVGSWRAKTTWVMLDLALDGNVAEAMRQIDRLLAAGEAPIGLLAQVSASLRRLAAATRLILQSETAGRRIGVGPALQQVGVNNFFLQKSEQQLRRLGRHRGSQLYRWLLEADLDLKGDSQIPPRLILERLIVRLASPSQGPPVAPANR
jgi:DNA polymerase-3 subunit delta